MHKFATLVVTMGMGMLFLPSVTPLAAQVDSDAYSVIFTAPFTFYAAMSSCLQALTSLPNRTQVIR